MTTALSLPASQSWSDVRLLHELEEVVETELNRHLKVAKEWMPHEYVPWSDGRELRRRAGRRGVVARAVQGLRRRPDRRSW